MATVQTVNGDVTINGNLRVTGTPPDTERTELAQESGSRLVIPFVAWRVWDAMQTNLPGTSSSDDLALIGGTFGTASPTIQSSDLKNAGSTTLRARCTIALPHEYVAAQTVKIRAHAGMKTTVASSAATIDFEVYRSDDEEGIGSDLCTTAPQSINSLADANLDFTITAATLNPGDTLDIRMTMVVNDSGTGTAVIGQVGRVELLIDTKG